MKKYTNNFSLLIGALLPLLMLYWSSCHPKVSSVVKDEISGEYYDWTKTNQPEQPWKHDYNKTLVTKFFLCSRNGEGNVEKVFLTFETALEVIRKLDNISLGIPKIVYLVGWQYNGHDSKYPAWDEVNKHLKREEDATALASLKWLIKEAQQYNTTVSLHINMIDAFEDSPLWSTYLENDIIAKDSLGVPIKGEVFMDMQSYQISYTQEWKLGYAQKRIDRLISMLPELKEGGTIHIDAFHSMRPSGPGEPISPYLGYSIEKEMATQRKIYRYWRAKGIDVTNEAGIYWLRKDPFLGLQAMSWHHTEANYIKEDWLNKPQNYSSLPLPLSAYTPMQCEQEIMKDPENLSNLLEQVALKLVPWYYKRNPDLSKYSNVIMMDDKVICPILWKEAAMIAYSKEQDITDMQFRLPSSWGNFQTVQMYELSLEGIQAIAQLNILEEKENAPTKSVNLNIEKGKTFVFIPIKNK